LFAGNDGGARHWAIATTLIKTAKLNGINPMAYLANVERVVSGQRAEWIAHAAAMELDGQHICYDHQPGRFAAGSAAAPIVNLKPAQSSPRRLR